jgi:HEAT repeat protein
VPVVLLLAASPLAAQGDPPMAPKMSGPPSATVLADLRPKVIGLLGSTDAERWKLLGPDALTVLRQLASDPAETPGRRTNAVLGIAYVESPDATDALRSYATDANVLPAVRQGAVRGFAIREGTSSVTPLTPLLADGDADVRQTTARVLGDVGGPAARAALQARLGAEASPVVRDEIQKALARTTN